MPDHPDCSTRKALGTEATVMHPWLLIMVLFFASAGGLVVEIVAGRLIAPYLGTSLYTWTSIISTVLAGLSIGNIIGGRLADSGHNPATMTFYCLVGAAILTAAIPLLSQGVANVLLPFGLPLPITVIIFCLLLFFLPAAAVGAVSPMVARLVLSANPDAQGRSLGAVYAAGTLGSILGSLAAGFIFISWLGNSATLNVVALSNLLLALFFVRRILPRRRAVASIFLAIVSLGILHKVSDSLPKICQEESAYYCIRTQSMDHAMSTPAMAMILDHTIHGINDQMQPDNLMVGYLAALDSIVQQVDQRKEKRHLLSLGGGAYSYPRAWLAAHPERDALVAEIDPMVTRIAKESMWLDRSDRLRIEHGDARLVLQELPEEPRFDVILGDVFNDLSVPPHLTTLEFAREIKKRLAPDGLYAVNVIDNARHPRFLTALQRTLKHSFPTVEVWVQKGQERHSGPINYLVVASERPFGLTQADGTSSSFPWHPLSPANLLTMVPEGSVPLLIDDHAPVDNLLLPPLF